MPSNEEETEVHKDRADGSASGRLSWPDARRLSHSAAAYADIVAGGPTTPCPPHSAAGALGQRPRVPLTHRRRLIDARQCLHEQDRAQDDALLRPGGDFLLYIYRRRWRVRLARPSAHDLCFICIPWTKRAFWGIITLNPRLLHAHFSTHVT